ncbi:MAG: SDR family oxidoreductase [Actinomyces sp.]|nr:MAG: SDR family oxidoreductase [Actinomyces sp.]
MTSDGNGTVSPTREVFASRPLAGRTALVTGAGQGVGRGIALALADAGARVVCAGRTVAKCETVAAEIGRRGGEAIAVGCDVKDAGQVTATVEAAVARFGGLDIVVNNAQEVPRGPILEVDDDAYRAGWESGPLATVRFMRAAHPHLAASPHGGVVINLASHAGVKPDPSRAGLYAGLKEEIRTIGRAAAIEWAPDGIRVFSILPLARTPALDAFEQADPERYAEVLAEIPQRRFGDPETDIGPVVVFLCTSAARYLTGISVPIDGGTAHIG